MPFSEVSAARLGCHSAGVNWCSELSVRGLGYGSWGRDLFKKGRWWRGSETRNLGQMFHTDLNCLSTYWLCLCNCSQALVGGWGTLFANTVCKRQKLTWATRKPRYLLWHICRASFLHFSLLSGVHQSCAISFHLVFFWAVLNWISLRWCHVLSTVV